MLLKINHIRKFGIFQNFTWDNTVLDKNSNPQQFKRLNILYARNYSGKTTLSRLLQMIEVKQRNPYYFSADFELKFSGHRNVTPDNILQCHRNVRVYNKDFVDRNLNWSHDTKGNIKPFSVMGQENKEIAQQIEYFEPYFNEDTSISNSFAFHLKQAQEKFDQANRDKDLANNRLNQDYARHARIMKEDRLTYGVNATYDRADLIQDMFSISSLTCNQLSDQEIEKLRLQTQANKMDDIKFQDFDGVQKLDSLWEKYQRLMGEAVTPSKIVQELEQNHALSQWAFTGSALHKEYQLEHCGFCGNHIAADRLALLDQYFDQKLLALTREIESLMTSCKSEKAIISEYKDRKLPNTRDFYQDLQSLYHPKNIQLTTLLDKRVAFFDQLETGLEQKKQSLNQSIKVDELDLPAHDLAEGLDQIKKLVDDHNARNLDFVQAKQSAQSKLKQDSLVRFKQEIDLDGQQQNIQALGVVLKQTRELLESIQFNYQGLKAEFEKLKTMRVSKVSGLNSVNEYLNHYFVAHHLKLDAIDDGTAFTVKRNDEDARYLSEGECSLISFCYFMATLKDVDLSETLIWIDDPISSLDNNNIYFVYSLIDAELCRPDAQGDIRFKQLFISTHNLDFYKFLNQLPINTQKGGKEFFLIERNATESHIRLLPDHIKRYSTEYHYLFAKIYQLHNSIESEINEDMIYNFGNNLRKFLEVHLAFKYPNNKNYSDNLKLFFTDGPTFSIINRYTNESSHLKEHLERGIQMTDSSEIKRVATSVITKLKENDATQYDALLTALN